MRSSPAKPQLDRQCKEVGQAVISRMLIRPPPAIQAPHARLEQRAPLGEAGGRCGLKTRSWSCAGAPSG